MGRPPHGHTQKLSEETKKSLSGSSCSDQGAEFLNRLDHKIKKRFFELKANMDAEKRKSIRLYEVMQELERRKDEHARILHKLKDERQYIQDHLNSHGLKVNTVEDYKVMTELWREGFDHLYVKISRSMFNSRAEEMRNKYGISWDFTYWNNSYMDLADLTLKEDLEYFESQYAAQVLYDDRRRHISNVINALKAEKRRREIEEVKQKGSLPVRDKHDTWQRSKLRD